MAPSFHSKMYLPRGTSRDAEIQAMRYRMRRFNPGMLLFNETVAAVVRRVRAFGYREHNSIFQCHDG